MKGGRTAKGSPLKAKPLRVAGQSLDEAIQKVIDNDFDDAALLIAVLPVFAALEFVRWYFVLPATRGTVLFFAALAVVGAAVGCLRLGKARKRVRELRLARDGERTVAELLEDMPGDEHRVFHDLVGPGFNVDHVLVGPQGVFVIETKTFSKPTSRTTIRYDGDRLLVGGQAPDRDPVEQARALAKWVGDLVKQSSGRTPVVRPVILFPGWWVDDQLESLKTDVWVLSANAFPGVLKHEPRRVSPEDVDLISFHISRYMRSEFPS